MKRQLSSKDIKDLKYQCRMGYIIPFFFFMIGSFLVLAILDFFLLDTPLKNEFMALTLIAMFAISILINYQMNRKYLIDIRNNEKVLIPKTIQRKESKTDYEAGSGNRSTLPHNNPMKSFIHYSLIIENTRFRVDKELFESCKDGDEVFFHMAPKSNFRLSIQLK
ncbi:MULTISPECIES: hypothetical protein [unclassified Lentimicrobium]|uniref:hypothetical protein n=1 Tax=unclassified Lentimicrobium TaxID=2677434 RepID=UPI0015546298|nr:MULTISPECIES: hypothetical protein [unclassified Lentimicrobium]NPD47649.1 hypothetical protein [Lentimicrobium sp. S6]NPD86525.1 hypothetical protein [Lentimicrobium sp. L6]